MSPARTERRRLDDEMVSRGIVQNRSRARAYILAGDVTVNGVAVCRAGATVNPGDEVALKEKSRFVSRGGDKLLFALETFDVPVSGGVAADIGASTGGFTDVLLQQGAARVYAVDVGYGQLDLKLRDDERVIVMERTNARFLEALPEPVDIVTIDVSFISLRLIFPAVRRILRGGASCIPLIKPQFEAGARDVGKGGVVRDPTVHERVLKEVLYAALDDFDVLGLVRSPLTGPAGNVEFLAHLRLRESPR